MGEIPLPISIFFYTVLDTFQQFEKNTQKAKLNIQSGDACATTLFPISNRQFVKLQGHAKSLGSV